MYTIMKVVFKKSPGSSNEYEEFTSDAEFRKYVFTNNVPKNVEPTIKEDDSVKIKSKKDEKNGKKLVVSAISGLLAEMDENRESPPNLIEEQTLGKDDLVSEKAADSDSDSGSKVKVVGLEISASRKDGNWWRKSDSPVFGQSQNRASTPVPPVVSEAQEIFLEGHLPSQSQLLVSDSETETQEGDEPDAPVILSGKMTLSLISLDAALEEEDRTLSALQSKQSETSSKESHKEKESDGK